ncbi:AAA family ATPase [Nocardioides sp. GY 10127]|uniref:AAA family ATPase n=1 Tax=Nocardioides sp. GY 10127 TaxID=2569762 RepID=UPI0010A888D9|nr:AAA family ATPase [Nocardioides sp. GY 10127]TIC80941.1 MinD/ParA family protein [Nocardioides sp. GY 10127]
MPLVVDSDTATITSLLEQLPAGSQAVDVLERMHAYLAEHPEEYLLVLGPHLDVAACLDACSRLATSRPLLHVVLVRHDLDALVLGQAMKAGARDVVPVAETGSLRASAERARQVFAALRGEGVAQQGRVVTVFSPKGGVGKTTLAVNLAMALAEGGRRKVCLVDLDLAFGDVAITMQLFPTHSIEHAVGSEASLDLAQLEGLMTRHPSSVQVLAAPTHPDVRERVTPALVAKTLGVLRTGFDVIVVDTAPAFDEQVLAALDETDECVVVATLDVPTLKNVKVALETMDMLRIAEGHRHLVLNRADDAVGLGPEKVESILGMPTAARLPSAVEVAAATNSGTPIVLSDPRHEVSRTVVSTAAVVLGEPLDRPQGQAPGARPDRPVEDSPWPPEERPRGLGLFRRRR